jgi:hypothetical protein
MAQESPKVKITDENRLTVLKSLLEQKILETQSEISRDEIKNIFSTSFEDNADLQVFNNLIDGMKDEIIEKIMKKLRIQYRYTHKFISKSVEEEKLTKESETKLVVDEKLVELEKQVEEKIKTMKNLFSKAKEIDAKLKEFYYSKSDDLFESNK